MKKLIILSVFIIGTLGAPSQQTLSVNEDGTYQFSYDTGSEAGNHFRTETRGPDGAIIGKYSYNDPTGELRVVNYRADESGFVSSEDGEIPQPAPSEVVAGKKDAGASTDNEDKQKEDAEQPSAAENSDVNEEEKSLKLEERIDDGPPEGFPVGFFSGGQFSGLRRLQEPPKADKETQKDDETSEKTPTTHAEWNPQPAVFAQPEAFPQDFFLHHFTGLRRLGEPAEDDESVQTIDGTKPNDQDAEVVTPTAETPKVGAVQSSYILPFPGLVPQLWQASSFHQPVHVYSYQQPNAYAYGYSY